jgi:hypothetical protein
MAAALDVRVAIDELPPCDLADLSLLQLTVTIVAKGDVAPVNDAVILAPDLHGAILG